MKVLIVEDTATVAAVTKRTLTSEGHSAKVADSGSAAISIFNGWSPDLVVLDLGLPDISGHAVLKRIRKSAPSLPILVISGIADDLAKVQAFELGADQYLQKPFRSAELIARVHRLSQRTTAAIHVGHLTIDPGARTVHKSGCSVKLAPKEFDLLIALARHRGRALTRQQILREVWGHLGAVQTRTVDEHIKSLRRQIGDDCKAPRYIFTVRKFGYRMAFDDRSTAG